MRERRGEPTADRAAGPLIWIHGASVGEIASVMPLIEQLASHQTAVLVTSGTVTSAAMAQQRLPQRRYPSIHSARRAAVCHAVPRPLAARPDVARGVRPLAESDPRKFRARHSADSRQRTRIGTLRSAHGGGFPRSIGNLLDRFDLCLARTPERRHAIARTRRTSDRDHRQLKLDVPAPPARENGPAIPARRDRHAPASWPLPRPTRAKTKRSSRRTACCGVNIATC